MSAIKCRICGEIFYSKNRKFCASCKELTRAPIKAINTPVNIYESKLDIVHEVRDSIFWPYFTVSFSVPVLLYILIDAFF